MQSACGRALRVAIWHCQSDTLLTARDTFRSTHLNASLLTYKHAGCHLRRTHALPQCLLGNSYSVTLVLLQAVVREEASKRPVDCMQACTAAATLIQRYGCSRDGL